MESEKKELLKTEKDILVGGNRVHMEDLGTSNPDLNIELTNHGPAGEIEYCISGSRDVNGVRMSKLKKGDTITFKLGIKGNGKFLVLINNVGSRDLAKVTARW